MVSGLGGESESGEEKSSTASETSESFAAATTGEPASCAGQRSLSDMRVLVGGLLSLVFALVLMLACFGLLACVCFEHFSTSRRNTFIGCTVRRREMTIMLKPICFFHRMST